MGKSKENVCDKFLVNFVKELCSANMEYLIEMVFVMQFLLNKICDKVSNCIPLQIIIV